MLELSGNKRKEQEELEALRKQGKIPAVLYGPKRETISLALEKKEFDKVFKAAGESTLVSFQLDKESIPVLIHEVQRDPVSLNVLHADLYQPPMDKKITLAVPLIFEGTPRAVRDLAGTLLKNIQQVEVRALPKDLPHEITVNVENLATFEDKLLLKNLAAAQGVEILGNQEDVVAQVVPPAKVEEELAKPVEEGVAEVEVVEKGKKEEEEVEAGAAGEAAPAQTAKEKPQETKSQ